MSSQRRRRAARAQPVRTPEETAAAAAGREQAATSLWGASNVAPAASRELRAERGGGMEKPAAGEERDERERDLHRKPDEEHGLEEERRLELAVGRTLDELTSGKRDRRQERERRERQHRGAAAAPSFERPAGERQQHDRPAHRDRRPAASRGSRDPSRQAASRAVPRPARRARSRPCARPRSPARARGTSSSQVSARRTAASVAQPPAASARRMPSIAQTANTMSRQNAAPNATATYSGAPETRLRPASSRYVTGLTVATVWIQPGEQRQRHVDGREEEDEEHGHLHQRAGLHRPEAGGNARRPAERAPCSRAARA